MIIRKLQASKSAATNIQDSRKSHKQKAGQLLNKKQHLV